jgi:hypothetical protein
MVEYIYFVKCPNCEDEHFYFFNDAKDCAMGRLSQKPIITQTEVNRNDFGECTDSCDLGTVWSWEDMMKDVPADPEMTALSKAETFDCDDCFDQEFDGLDNSLDTVPDKFSKPLSENAIQDGGFRTDGYRTALACYDSDDFDINVEFGLQDEDEYEVEDQLYLLRPGQTVADLVVYLSRKCGFTNIYVYGETSATRGEMKTAARFETQPGTHDYRHYGTIEDRLVEACNKKDSKPVPADMTIESLVEEMEESEDTVECKFCYELFDKSECEHDRDYGWLCSRCQRAISEHGGDIVISRPLGEAKKVDSVYDAEMDKLIAPVGKIVGKVINGLKLSGTSGKDHVLCKAAKCIYGNSKRLVYEVMSQLIAGTKIAEDPKTRLNEIKNQVQELVGDKYVVSTDIGIETDPEYEFSKFNSVKYTPDKDYLMVTVTVNLTPKPHLYEDSAADGSLTKWVCYFDDREVGIVEAADEHEAYSKMEQTWPELDYGRYDGVAVVEPITESLVEGAKSVDSVEFHYDSLTVEIVTGSTPATLEEPEDYLVGEYTDEFDYQVDTDTVIEALWDHCITEEDAVDVPGGLEALEDDATWQGFLDLHFEELLDKYNDKLLEYFREDAEEAAKEKFQNDYDEMRSEGPDSQYYEESCPRQTMTETIDPRELVELEYPSLTVTLYGSATYDLDGLDDFEYTGSHVFLVPKVEVATAIWENWITEADVVDVDGGLDALEDDDAWEKFLETHFDALFEKYNEQLLIYFKEEAEEDFRKRSQEEHQMNLIAAKQDRAYDEWRDKKYFDESVQKPFLEEFEDAETHRANLTDCPECGSVSYDMKEQYCTNCGLGL